MYFPHSRVLTRLRQKICQFMKNNRYQGFKVNISTFTFFFSTWLIYLTIIIVFIVSGALDLFLHSKNQSLEFIEL